MKDIITILKSKDRFISYKPTSEKQICVAEDRLSLKFDEDYKRYVKEFGSGSYVGHELTGVTNCPEDDVVDLTIREREVNPDIPANWYVLELTGMDGRVIWQSEDGSIYLETKRIYSSLIEYVENT